jgi:hypothetical protein
MISKARVMTHSIFLSHSVEDTQIARELYDNLTRAQLTVWVDYHELDIATTRADQIKKAIQVCDVFIALLSPASLATAIWFQEWKFAERQRKYIVPILTEPIDYPVDWRCYRAFDLESLNDNFFGLIAHLRSLLAPSALSFRSTLLFNPKPNPALSVPIADRTTQLANHLRHTLLSRDMPPDPDALDQFLADRLDISLRFAQSLLRGGFPETEIDDVFLEDIARAINNSPDTLRSMLGRLRHGEETQNGLTIEGSGAN